MDTTRPDSGIFQEHKTAFLEFFEQKDEIYREITDQIIEKGLPRFLVNFEDLRNTNQELARELLNNPASCLGALKDAANEYVRSNRTSNVGELEVGIHGPIGNHMVNPRGLRADLISKLICVEGIVTKASLVNPKLVMSVSYCAETNKWLTREYYDATDLGKTPTETTVPTADVEGHPVRMDFGRSKYLDHQVLTIQERPETSPAGQMPRSCEVVVDKDLADVCKPGDRVKIYGLYKVLNYRINGNTNGIFKAMVVANCIQIQGQTIEDDLTSQDIANIKNISKNNNILELIGRSIAPSIYGHDKIKKALCMMMVGGNEINMEDGTHIRGDVNVLMVGDPSTAKSQLLRHVLEIAPLAVHTTGRGSSGVGLTAAVTSDPETGERKLEAGAMVIADRGVVCIDEFDKMDESDRVAIHEALEQQTVTISKAGIHATLNARCTVVAAANPVWGTYNPKKSPMDNIGLPDSLLSRFDLLFIVLDDHDPTIDAMIASHVLRSHRWRGQVTEVHNGMYVQPDPLLHGNSSDPILTINFLKKYLTYAKRLTPQLSQPAIDEMVSSWSELRQIVKQMRRSQPITPRAFETLLRLSTANAKLRLADKVIKKDAAAAIDMLKFALLGENGEPPKRRKARKPRTQKPKPKPKETVAVEEPEFEESGSDNEAVAVESESESEEEEEEEPEKEELLSAEEVHSKMISSFQYVLKTMKSESQLMLREFIDIVEKQTKFTPTLKQAIGFLEEMTKKNTIVTDGEGYEMTIYFLN